MRPIPDRIRIVLAEDHFIVAQALALVLRDTFDVVEMVSDGRQLIESVSRLRPDVVLTDLSMPRMDGLAAIRILRALAEPPAIIVLSMHADPRLVAAATAAGAGGYVLKESAAADLQAAVHAVHAGGSYWPAGLGDARTDRQEAADAPVPLTVRQSQVLGLTARGYGMKQIAEVLQISPRTVESHKYQMMESLAARTTAELVRHALRLGLVEIGDRVEVPGVAVRDRRAGRPMPRSRARRLAGV